MKQIFILLIAILTMASCTKAPESGVYELTIVHDQNTFSDTIEVSRINDRKFVMNDYKHSVLFENHGSNSWAGNGPYGRIYYPSKKNFFIIFGNTAPIIWECKKIK